MILRNNEDLKKLLCSKERIPVNKITFEPFRKAFADVTHSMYDDIFDYYEDDAYTYDGDLRAAYKFKEEDFDINKFVIHWEDEDEGLFMYPKYTTSRRLIINFLDDWLDENYYVTDYEFSVGNGEYEDAGIVFDTGYHKWFSEEGKFDIDDESMFLNNVKYLKSNPDLLTVFGLKSSDLQLSVSEYYREQLSRRRYLK